MSGLFLNDWDSAEKMYKDFEDTYYDSENDRYAIADKDDIEILLASYTQECYEGDAFVLFKRKSDGKLYEVNGGHCSCYGLEGQWNPEETTVEELEHRLTKGRLGRSYSYGSEDENKFAIELGEILCSLKEAM